MTKRISFCAAYRPPKGAARFDAGKHASLWKRIRFSMLSLLALMTLVGIGLGIMVFAVRAPSPLPPTPTLQPTFPAPLPIDTDDDPFGSLAPDPNIR